MEASAETLMKFVDSICFASREGINSAVLEVGYAMDGDEGLTWVEVPLAGSIPHEPLDARFSLLANFCQLEKLIKTWLPQRGCGTL